MVDETTVTSLNSNRNCFITQGFYRIAYFQVVLAATGNSGELPCRHGIDKKWIVERLGNFMAQCGYVFNAGIKESWRDPTGKHGHPDRCRISSGIKDERMEAQRKRPRWPLFQRKDKSVGKQHNVDCVRRKMVGADLSDHGIKKRVIEKTVQ